jgi:hypothetical protein
MSVVVIVPGHTQRIPSHKYILATGSSVFYAMFYGGLADTKEEIEVPDVEPTAFLTLLRFVLPFLLIFSYYYSKTVYLDIYIVMKSNWSLTQC